MCLPQGSFADTELPEILQPRYPFNYSSLESRPFKPKPLSPLMLEYRQHFWPQPLLLHGKCRSTKARGHGTSDKLTNSYVQSVGRVDHDPISLLRRNPGYFFTFSPGRTGGSVDLLQALQDAHQARKALTRDKAFVIFGSVLLARAAILLEYLQLASPSRYHFPRAMLNLQFELVKKEDVFLLLSKQIAAQFTKEEISDTFCIVKEQISLLLPPATGHPAFSIVVAWPSEAYPHDEANSLDTSHHYLLRELLICWTQMLPLSSCTAFILGSVPREVIPSYLQKLDVKWSSVLEGHVVHVSMEDEQLAKDTIQLLQSIGAKVSSLILEEWRTNFSSGDRATDYRLRA
ncbi:hypothetical protein V5O48_012776 [Marasmius crinis-equi]|uniref:Uncharacterized protein n=1 Tax=Marasmius crinis-equi TaxID=585013 RepID=A0ABR3F1W8_9AGAR